MQPTLLILAAGMGSRYGGLKQLDPMGPGGNTVLDYSVYDAIRAGFGKVVFVIRGEFEKAFKETLGNKFENKIEVGYAFQELSDLPSGYTVPKDRQKPWGTAHAVRAARNEIDTPFAVINADDFYGQDAYAQLAFHFARRIDATQLNVCMVGYPLKNTLSDHGAVNRGICHVEEGVLRSVEEYIEIERNAEGHIFGNSSAGKSIKLDPEVSVSMNFWGFTPALFEEIERQFVEFLENEGQQLKSECYLPSVVNNLIQAKQAECTVIETSSSWFGVTYPDDKAFVQAKIAELIDEGIYPREL